MNISVVIPTYKNKDVFLKNLRHNLHFFQDCEVIVVNDDPAESLKEDFLPFPRVKLVENKQNLGFSQTVNKGMHEAKNAYVLLLNSDVLLHDSSYERTLKHFQNNETFAVSFAQKEKDGSIVGKNRIYWKNGFFNHSRADDLQFGYNAWAEGGSCLIDRKKFLELDGFDQLYAPFYWEDIDLSYRAWKTGYVVLFDPSVLVEHHHETTIGKYYQSNRIKKIATRNQFLFIWKNITQTKLLFEHLLLLPKHILYYLLTGNFAFISGFFQAIAKLPVKKIKSTEKRNDYEILSIFKK